MHLFTSIAQWTKNSWYFLQTFFPIQLLLLHLRRSHILMIFWLLIFLFVGGHLGTDYGFHHLFLSPEYFGQVNFFSYFSVGIMAGLFVMSFHISSYIYYSYRYPFLATLSRPLYKFCINNSAIPLIFYGFYLFRIWTYLSLEGHNIWFILSCVLGLLLGSIVIIAVALGYFFSTLRNLADQRAEKALDKIIPKQKSTDRLLGRPVTIVNYYLKNFYEVRVTRGVGHYQLEQLMQTIQQHHVSASVLFLVLLSMVVVANVLGDYQFIKIPAGASIFLIFSLYLMITGALYSRLKTWTLTVGIATVLLLNYLSGWERFQRIHYAFGMDYQGEEAEYSYAHLERLTHADTLSADLASAVELLNTWKARQTSPKPKLIILNVSGGGLRSSLFTMQVLQQLDSLYGDDFYRQVHLIVGSSGGMLGASYYRQLRYMEDRGDSVDAGHPHHLRNMGSDLLNPIAFTLAVNDLFVRFRRFEFAGHSYLVDRGHAFDEKLVDNTEGLLEGRFGDWASAEQKAEMPFMVFAPTIIGDGRKLLMSNRNLSFLSYSEPFAGKVEYDAVEFKRLFAEHDWENLRMSTALRMSASFPYITPLINLPSKPQIELIDAGARDNEGFELALRYVMRLREWIDANTSGVVFLQIKANRPDEIPIVEEPSTRLDQLTKPIGGIVQSFHNLQIYNKALLTQLAREKWDIPMDVIRFSLFKEEDNLSLSWHLTKYEKRFILQAMQAERNQQALAELEKAIKKAG